MKLLTTFGIMALSFKLYAAKPAEILPIFTLDTKIGDEFYLSNSNHETHLKIENLMRDEKAKLLKINGSLDCDASLKIKKKGPLKFTKKGSKLNFTLKKEVQLTIPQEVNECELILENNSQIRKIVLKKDIKRFPFLESLYNQNESCASYTNDDEVLPIESFYLNNTYPMMTCAKTADQIEILQDSKESFLKKVETLTGTRPEKSFINNENPYAELDFSKAPHFDAIYLSSLIFRRDFTGTVLARILKYHADQGTLVNIISTDYMNGKKDKSFLKDLASYNGNIRIQNYTYHDRDKGIKFPTRYLVNYLRNLHMKMLLTISDSNPELNTLITGGRNVHDGFLFSTKPNFEMYPEMDQFPKEDPYAYWQDLELKITSKELARSVYSHFLKFWDRDIETQKMKDARSFKSIKSVRASDILDSDKPSIKHFMSLPFEDSHALESLYVDMIDNAKKTLHLSTPYLRPTKNIMKAFERAISRGVKVKIQTRIDLQGDTQAWLYEETNKAAINELYNKVELYEWTEESILHTKMMIIDGKFAFFGSVNLSRRSFIQDIEHGMLIHDEAFVSKLENIFLDYNNRSHQIDEKQKRNFFVSIIVSLLQNQF